MEEYREVPHLVGDLVEHHGDGGGEPHGHAHEETGSDREPVNEVVDAVPHQAHGAHVMGMVPFLLVLRQQMAVAPVDDFLHGEREDDAPEHDGKPPRRAPLLRHFREHVDEHVAQERPRGEADEVEEDPPENLLAQEEERRPRQGDRAHEENAAKSIEGGLHAEGIIAGKHQAPNRKHQSTPKLLVLDT